MSFHLLPLCFDRAATFLLLVFLGAIDELPTYLHSPRINLPGLPTVSFLWYLQKLETGFGTNGSSSFITFILRVRLDFVYNNGELLYPILYRGLEHENYCFTLSIL